MQAERILDVRLAVERLAGSKNRQNEVSPITVAKRAKLRRKG
jgi:hypothetical protein